MERPQFIADRLRQSGQPLPQHLAHPVLDLIAEGLHRVEFPTGGRQRHEIQPRRPGEGPAMLVQHAGAPHAQPDDERAGLPGVVHQGGEIGQCLPELPALEAVVAAKAQQDDARAQTQHPGQTGETAGGGVTRFAEVEDFHAKPARQMRGITLCRRRAGASREAVAEGESRAAGRGRRVRQGRWPDQPTAKARARTRATGSSRFPGAGESRGPGAALGVRQGAGNGPIRPGARPAPARLPRRS